MIDAEFLSITPCLCGHFEPHPEAEGICIKCGGAGVEPPWDMIDEIRAARALYTPISGTSGYRRARRKLGYRRRPSRRGARVAAERMRRFTEGLARHLSAPAPDGDPPWPF